MSVRSRVVRSKTIRHAIEMRVRGCVLVRGVQMLGALLSENAFCLGRGRLVLRDATLLAVLLLTPTLTASGALAQCVNGSDFTFSGSVTRGGGVTRSVIPTASPIVSITNTVNTAFL